MTFFDDRIAPVTLSGIRASIIGLMGSSGLDVSNWRLVGVSMQMLEAMIGMTTGFSSVVPVTVRGFASLDTSTDPGDVDPFDPTNETLPPGKGFLSALGEGTYDTTREEQTFASGFVTFVNAGPGARVLSPFGLIYTWTDNSPPNPPPTYTNVDDPAIYIAGSVTVPAGTSLTIPLQAQVAGSAASCPSASLSLTTSLLGCSGTNAAPVTGNDREDRDTYIARCRQEKARLSLGGPADAYAYLAAKNLDGTPLLNAGTPPVPTGITRVQVTQDSATGIVNAYYASASGPAIADDVTAANQNISVEAFAVPGAITFSGFAASTVSIHVAGTAKIKARIGVTAAAVAQAIVAALTKNGKTIPIGGVDQIAGAGVVYTVDLQAFARSGFQGLYDVVVTTPGGPTTAIPVGNVPVISSVAGDGLGSGDWIVTIVP